jgi:hypothetical protein
MRRLLRQNGLSFAFGILFLVTLAAQAFAGHADFNQHQLAHESSTVSLWRYVMSSAFGVDVLENWQSEYLQFTLYILGTIWLLQRGSPESKEPGKEGRETQAEQLLGRHARRDSPAWAKVGGVRTFLFSNSLLLVMGTIWLASWLVQSLTGRVHFNAEQIEHRQAPVGWLEYVGTSDFWARTLQNWQSEFLAIGSMAILAVYLRQRGSPESKPVGAPHDQTDVEG